MEDKLVPYQSWRQNELYCNEINDLLLSNVKSLKILYDSIANVKDAPRQKDLVEIYLGKLPTID